ncbi:hypothetical protein vBAmePPT11V19_00062 [Alteromonas phage vB_AmeP_PT11-V19]|nr:hypothetical protein vBAmePPT11V19_00062 [Alteromonas phage vB_AmeP_PT11-V19]
MKSNKLTKAENALYDLLIQGYSYPEAADKLCRSLNTVKFHASSIFKKLEVSSINKLIAKHYARSKEPLPEYECRLVDGGWVSCLKLSNRPDVFNRVPVYVKEIDSYNLLNVRDVRQKKE